MFKIIVYNNNSTFIKNSVWTTITNFTDNNYNKYYTN